MQTKGLTKIFTFIGSTASHIRLTRKENVE